MRVCNLSSGSDGNCTYVEAGSLKMLIDAGISCSEIVKRLQQINVDYKDISIILITHEHNDHIRGLDVFARKCNAKILVHEKAISCVYLKTKNLHTTSFLAFGDAPFNLKDVKVCPIALSHDSEYNCGFAISHNNQKVSFVSDVGFLTENNIDICKQSDLIFIESNHDEDMVMANENYTLQLKRRILSKKGHLSNIDCAKAIQKWHEFGTRQFMLCHLSTKNNTQSLAMTTVLNYLASVGIENGNNINVGLCTLDVSYDFVIK